MTIISQGNGSMQIKFRCRKFPACANAHISINKKGQGHALMIYNHPRIYQLVGVLFQNTRTCVVHVSCSWEMTSHPRKCCFRGFETNIRNGEMRSYVLHSMISIYCGNNNLCMPFFISTWNNTAVSSTRIWAVPIAETIPSIIAWKSSYKYGWLIPLT